MTGVQTCALPIYIVFRKQGAYRPINQPAGQHLFFGRSPFSLKKSTRELTGSIVLLRVIDRQGKKWLRLGEAVGLSRFDLEEDHLLLPGVRYAVDAYVGFVATRPWIEGVASSLTELFAPQLMADRLAALTEHYPWIDADAFAYFRARPAQASRDSDHGLSVVMRYCRSVDDQRDAVDALQFKCDVLWAQLDAIYYHCVMNTEGSP